MSSNEQQGLQLPEEQQSPDTLTSQVRVSLSYSQQQLIFGH